MGLGRGDLVLCWGTLARTPLLERLAPAREAGFAGVSLTPFDYERVRASGSSDAELRRRVADAGLAFAELDGITTWLPGQEPPTAWGELGRALRTFTAERLCPIAEALGARSLTAVEFYGTRVEVGAAVESFARVCDRAREHGLLVHLEFLPWAGIPDLPTAWEIVRGADRRNGGLLVDSWHLFRSGAEALDLRAIPGDRVLGVQLDDAPARAEADLAFETQHRRLLPGEGSFDLAGLVRVLDEIGSAAPTGVEVFSDALAQRPAAEVARASAEATRRVLSRARGAGRAAPAR